MAQDKEKESYENSHGALFIPAGILTGIGVGFLIENIAAGTMIGLGLGFLTYAIISVIKKN